MGIVYNNTVIAMHCITVEVKNATNDNGQI